MQRLLDPLDCLLSATCSTSPRGNPVPGAHFFILNSAKVIQDLLVKRPNIYSNRPRSTMLSDLMNTAWLIPFMNNTDEWRDHRRLFRREFDTADATVFNRAHQVQATRRLLHRLLTSTDYEGELRLRLLM
ncbi:hypothetical protein DFH06DRAFT_727253 [Mycena polygramma]|nr:hypothetical protein DFH06DRAFT_727253 [Mycena polygramma]